MQTNIEALPKSGHGTWIEINLDRLTANLNTLKEKVGFETQVMAVVKANAYGHGLIETSRALMPYVQYLGVSNLYEALELKEHGIETPIFLFGRLFGSEIRTAIAHELTLSLSSFEEAEEISTIASSIEKKATVHIKVDTGMGRLGIPLHEAVEVTEKIAALPNLILDGIYTHLPTAEKKDGFGEAQLQGFSTIILELKAKGISFRLKHAANSAASLCRHKGIFNLIRPGLILYGIYPALSLKSHGTYQPILSLKSRIMLIKRLEKGQSVGYGRDFVTGSPTNIAILPIGYSHGYPYDLSSKAWVLLRGKRFPIAGRVSMDFLCIELGDTEASVGEEITLIGEDGNEAILVEDVAGWANTIPYEIVTRLASRLPRFYDESENSLKPKNS